MDLDDALTELVEQSGDRLLRVGYQLTHDASAAQDLVQEALMRVYVSARRRGRQPDDLYAYLRRAVVNEYVRTRRLRRSTEVVTNALPERASTGDPAGVVVDRAALWAVLGTLSRRQRAVLVLRYYEDLTHGEIAALLDCREATVRSLAKRGLDQLRVSAAERVAEEPR